MPLRPDEARDRMVRQHLQARGISDPRVLHAMATVAREDFVSAAQRRQAYGDRPLPISGGQTISQPYVVALMTQLLELVASDHVLEIGTGSGYAAAVLSLVAEEVVTVERLPELATRAAEQLQAGGYTNVVVHTGDGSTGWAESGPYDAILVSASGPGVPASLVDQLARGGRLVMPVGPPGGNQRLVLARRRDDGTIEESDLGGVAFVPLIGREGWGS